MDAAHAVSRDVDIGLALVVVGPGMGIDAWWGEDGDLGCGAGASCGFRGWCEAEDDGALAADGLDQVHRGGVIGTELMVHERKGGAVDEDEWVRGVDKGGTDGDLFGNTGRRHGDLVLTRACWEKLACHAASRIFEPDLDAGAGTVVTADPMVTPFFEPTIRPNL